MRSLALLCGLCSTFTLVGLAGCGSDSTPTAKEAVAANFRGSLTSVRESLFAERPTITTYRSAVQQLNSYLDQAQEFISKTPSNPEEAQQQRSLAEEMKVFQLSPEQEKRLMAIMPAGSQEEVKSIFGRNFTIVDAYHLDGCFLFHDAAQALRQHLGSEPRELATEAFAWIIRQVDLQETPRRWGQWPSHDILRRGTGNAEERLRVFLSLVGQYELDCGVLTRQQPARNPQAKPEQVPWLAAVLIKGELYLFDPLQGKPVYKDAAKRQLATWKEVQAQPELLQAYLPEQSGVRATKELLANSQLWLDFEFSAFSPRMKWLEDQLEKERAAGELPVQLHFDWEARAKRFEAAQLGLPIRAWPRADRGGATPWILADYVREVQRTDRDRNSIARPMDVVVPWHLLPAWLRHDGARGDKDRYTGLYYKLMTEREREILLTTDRMSENELQRRLITPFQRVFFAVRLAPGGHRDLLVRGRPESVVQRILQHEDHIDRLLNQLHTQQDSEEELRESWSKAVVAAETNLALARDNYERNKGPATEQEYMQVARAREKLWSGKEMLLGQLSVEWGQSELREHMTYYMALAKTDLALRAEWKQRRQAATTTNTPKTEAGDLSPLERWRSALFWYRRYEVMTLPHGGGQWLAAVRRQIAECEAAIQRLEGEKK